MDFDLENDKLEKLKGKNVLIKTKAGNLFYMKVEDLGFGARAEGDKKEFMLLTENNILNSGLEFYRHIFSLEDDGWTDQQIKNTFGVLGQYREAWFIRLNQIENLSLISLSHAAKLSQYNSNHAETTA